MTDTLIRPRVSRALPLSEVGGVQRWRVLRLLQVVSLIAADLLMVYTAYRLAYALRYRVEVRTAAEIQPPEQYQEIVIIMTACLLGVFAFFRLYIPRRGHSRIDLLYSLFLAVTFGFVLGLFTIAMVYRDIELPRLVYVSWWAIVILAVWVARVIIDGGLRLSRAHGIDTVNVLIVGAGESGRIVLVKIRHAPELGYQVVGFVDDSPLDPPSPGAPILGTLADVPRLIGRRQVSELIIAAPRLEQRDILELVASCARANVNVKL
ncbi:MAG: hypothetical protein M3O34_02525, partial [Chloroflexota bacterium]|nr:hypothetical protein [Chloroflexota bacterium]